MQPKCLFIFKANFFFALILLLSACQSTGHIDNYSEMQNSEKETQTDKQHVSGFLSDYSKLSKTEGLDGEEVLRWVSPVLEKGQFNKVMLEPVYLFPVEDQSVEITQASQQEIRQYFDTQLRKAFSSKFEMTDQADANVAQIKLAITAIELSTEGMKVTEVLPYGAVIGLVRAATGTRNQEVSVAIEMEVLNSASQAPVIAVVRVGQGESVRMLWDANFSLKNVQDLLDEWVEIAANGFSKLINSPSN